MVLATILFLSRMVGFEHTTRGFDPQQKGGITPVRHRRILQGSEAKRNNPSPSATNVKCPERDIFYLCWNGDLGLGAITKLLGSTMSRFCKHSAAKSLRMRHRHKVPRQSLTIRHKNQMVLATILFLSRMVGFEHTTRGFGPQNLNTKILTNHRFFLAPIC